MRIARRFQQAEVSRLRRMALACQGDQKTEILLWERLSAAILRFQLIF
jgi:hypothetical protein